MMKDDLAILIKFLQGNPQGDLYELFRDCLYRAGISTIRQQDLYLSMGKNPFTYGPDGEILTCGITYLNPEQFQFELAKARALRDLEDAARAASVPLPEDIRDQQSAIEDEFHAVCDSAWREYLCAKGLSANFTDSKTCHKIRWDGMTPKLM